MYFEDLTCYSYKQKRPMTGVVNVGWLSRGHLYQQGRPPWIFVVKLFKIAECGLPHLDAHVNDTRGHHDCELCDPLELSDPYELDINKKPLEALLGHSVLWIPSGKVVYASPLTVLHYIVDHGYLPPAEFIEAVISLPEDTVYSGQDDYDRRCVEMYSRDVRE